MQQVQRKDFERGQRRKGELSANFYLGHAVKNCMTVIESDGALSEYLEVSRSVS